MENSGLKLNDSSNWLEPVISKQELELDDYLLWQNFLKGDESAIAKIYRRYVDHLFAYGCHIYPNKQVVKDTIQDVFFHLIDKREKLTEAKSVKAYLFASFRRRLLKSIKTNKKNIHSSLEGDEVFLIEVDFYQTFDGSSYGVNQSEMIKNFCNQLPARQREIINLKFFEDLSYAEIAEVMNLSDAKTVRTITYRILKKLSEIAGPHKHYFESCVILMSSCISLVL